MEKLNIEIIEKLSHNFSANPSDSYIKSYPFLKSHFEETHSFDKKSLTILSHMVYGWMPKILRLKITGEEFSILQKAKTNRNLTIDELKVLKSCINNSLVGTSKFLHFTNPKLYPILDSKIFKFWKNKDLNNGSLKPKDYLKYQDIMLNISGHEKFKSIHRKVNKELGYNVTPIRATELIVFQSID